MIKFGTRLPQRGTDAFDFVVGKLEKALDTKRELIEKFTSEKLQKLIDMMESIQYIDNATQQLKDLLGNVIAGPPPKPEPEKHVQDANARVFRASFHRRIGHHPPRARSAFIPPSERTHFSHRRESTYLSRKRCRSRSAGCVLGPDTSPRKFVFRPSSNDTGPDS